MVQDTRATKGPGDLRPLEQPLPITVRTDAQGLPVSVVRGRWAEVTSISDRWRIDDEWWRDRQVSRMYYECALETGRPIIIFLDLVSGSWFTHQ